MPIERKKKTINVDKKVKKKPVYEDKRVEPNPTGPVPIEFQELTPELEAFCQLMADNTPRSQIMTLIPNMSPYKYRTWLEKENVLARIDELKAEALMTNAGQLEPAMVSLVMGLTRYFKAKAALLDLNESVADKVLNMAVDFCKALSPLTGAGKKDEPRQETGLPSPSSELEKIERKPMWDSSEIDEIEVEDDEPDDKEEKDEN